MTDYKSREAGTGRKEDGENSLPPSPFSSGRLLDWRKQRGGRVAVTAYCLSSVCCGSSLSAHSSRPGYLYPLNIHAGGGRLQSFSSLHILWRHGIEDSACWERACLHWLSNRNSPFKYWTVFSGVFRTVCCNFKMIQSAKDTQSTLKEKSSNYHCFFFFFLSCRTCSRLLRHPVFMCRMALAARTMDFP